MEVDGSAVQLKEGDICLYGLELQVGGGVDKSQILSRCGADVDILSWIGDRWRKMPATLLLPQRTLLFQFPCFLSHIGTKEGIIIT